MTGGWEQSSALIFAHGSGRECRMNVNRERREKRGRQESREGEACGEFYWGSSCMRARRRRSTRDLAW